MRSPFVEDAEVLDRYESILTREREREIEIEQTYENPFNDFLGDNEIEKYGSFQNTENYFESELTDTQLQNAVKQNIINRDKYGWRKYVNELFNFFNVYKFYNLDVNLVELSKKVSEWQKSRGYKNPDGIIGIWVWTVLQEQLGLHNLSSYKGRINVERAVKLNKKYEIELWGGQKQLILDVINKGNQLSEEYFAYAIAKFQESNKIKSDGILGPDTKMVIIPELNRIDPGFDISQTTTSIPKAAAKTKELLSRIENRLSESYQSILDKLIAKNELEYSLQNINIGLIVLKSFVSLLSGAESKKKSEVNIEGIFPAIVIGSAIAGGIIEYFEKKNERDEKIKNAKGKLALIELIKLMKNNTWSNESEFDIEAIIRRDVTKAKYNGSTEDIELKKYTIYLINLEKVANDFSEIDSMAISSIINVFSRHTRIIIDASNTETGIYNWTKEDIYVVKNRRNIKIGFSNVHPKVSVEEPKLDQSQIKLLSSLTDLWNENGFKLRQLKLDTPIIFRFDIKEGFLGQSTNVFIKTVKFNDKIWVRCENIEGGDLTNIYFDDIYSIPYSTPNRRLVSRLRKNYHGYNYHDMILEIVNEIMEKVYNNDENLKISPILYENNPEADLKYEHHLYDFENEKRPEEDHHLQDFEDELNLESDNLILDIEEGESILTKPFNAEPKSLEIPFSRLPIVNSYWPLISSDSNATVISYITKENKFIGNSSRRFLADRDDGKRYHVAIDLYAKYLDPVISCEDGQILKFKHFYHGAWALLVKHNDLIINYGEVDKDSLNKLGLRVGDFVKAGQQIGLVGKMYKSSMLHFEIYTSSAIDTERYFKGGSIPKNLLNPTNYLLYLQNFGLKAVSNSTSTNVTANWSHAIRLNNFYKTNLGWEQYQYQINDFLLPFSGQSNVSLDESSFAYAVSKWQQSIGFTGKNVDGVIGPDTWRRLEPLVKTNTQSQPLTNVTGNVPSGFTQTIYNGIKGLKKSGSNTSRLDTKLVQLAKENKISITQEELDIFQRIANVETSGYITSFNSYDRGIVSIGFMQFTIHVNKIQEWIKLNPTPWKKYGIEIDSINKFGEKIDGIKGVTKSNIDSLRWGTWASNFYYASIDDDIIISEIQLAKLYLKRHISGLKYRMKNDNAYNIFVSSYYNKDSYVKGLFQASYNNHPSNASKCVLDSINETSFLTTTQGFLEIYKNNLIKIGWSRLVNETSKGTNLKISNAQHEFFENENNVYDNESESFNNEMEYLDNFENEDYEYTPIEQTFENYEDPQLENEISKNSVIIWLKETLNKLYSLSLPLTTKLDNDTLSIMNKFQRENGLSITSKINPQTERALLEKSANVFNSSTSVASTIADAKLKIEDWTNKAVVVKSEITSTYRNPSLIFSLVLHQMAFTRSQEGIPSDPNKFLKTGAHFCILKDGRIIQLHPISRMIWHAQCLSPLSVGVEFEGNFPSVNGKWWKDKDAKYYQKNIPSPEQYESGKFLIQYLKAVIGLRNVNAHRQSSNQRTNDPGPHIWKNVGEWAIQNLGLTDGGINAKCGTGSPIDPRWRTFDDSVVMKESDYEIEYDYVENEKNHYFESYADVQNEDFENEDFHEVELDNYEDTEFDESENEQEYYDSEIKNINTTIAENRRYATALGWDKYVHQINNLLLPFSGQNNVSLGEQAFAEALEKWQIQNGFGNNSDGILGPNTWKKMKQALGLNNSSSQTSSKGPVGSNIFIDNKFYAKGILDTINAGFVTVNSNVTHNPKTQLEAIVNGIKVLNLDPRVTTIQILPILYHICQQAMRNNYKEIIIGSLIRAASNGKCSGHCAGRCIDINFKGGSFSNSGATQMVINILNYMKTINPYYAKNFGFGLPFQGSFFKNIGQPKFKSTSPNNIIDNQLKLLVPTLGIVFPDNDNHLHIQVKWI